MHTDANHLLNRVHPCASAVDPSFSTVIAEAELKQRTLANLCHAREAAMPGISMETL
jgi:RNase H-fold protein (predicted Holliday junction resolvase)